MQLERIVTDSAGKELTERGTPLFPFSLHDNDMHAFPSHSVPWHWHEECEILRVTKGTLAFENAAESTILTEGDGAFVNSNALHAMRPDTDGACRVTTIVFDPGIVGASASVFDTRYIRPLTQDKAVPGTVFGSRSGERRDAFIRMLVDIEAAYAEKEFGYELYIRNALSLVWLEVMKALSADGEKEGHRDDPYIRRMLTYVHENYAAVLTLQDIAQSADVSCRTCSRAFRSQLHMSVFEYVQEYRVKIAAEKLLSTDDSVTDICFLCGFADPSYFTRVFRAKTGMSPSRYRHEARVRKAE